MHTFRTLTLTLAAAALCCAADLGAQIQTTRALMRNVTRLHNSNPETLTGVGVVVGLQGTGSSAPATRRAMTNLVLQNGLNVTREELAAGSAALVTVTATLPAFSRIGNRIDVRVQSIGDASSLRGGELLTCELKGVDDVVYATADGKVFVNGFAVVADGARATKNHTVAGQITNGGMVRQELQYSMFSEAGDLELQLLTPSPFNATSVVRSARAALQSLELTAHVVDAGLVRIPIPAERRNFQDAMQLLAMLNGVPVEMENPSRVVIDEANGIVIAGAGVQISPCVMALTDLTVIVEENPTVSQPEASQAPGSTTINPGATTQLVPLSQIEADQTHTPFFIGPTNTGADVKDLLDALKATGMTPQQTMNVFQKLKQGGYLHAELLIQ